MWRGVRQGQEGAEVCGVLLEPQLVQQLATTGVIWRNLKVDLNYTEATLASGEPRIKGIEK